MSRRESRSEWLQAGVLPDPADVRNLVEAASDIAVSVAPDGTVSGISVNPECPSLGCLDHWVGRDFMDFLAEESRVKLRDRLEGMRADPGLLPRPIELNHVDNATWEFPIKYTLHRVDDGGVLLLGRDMQPIAEVQQRLVSEQMARERDQQRLRGEQTFYHVVLEASETPIVMVEPDSGRIRDLNSAAAHLFGTKVDTLGGNVFSQVFEGTKQGRFIDTLRASASAEEIQPLEAVSRRNGRLLRLLPVFFRAAGELFLLVRVDPVEDNEISDPKIAHSLAALFAATSDAIVLTDARGMISDANDAFLVLADAAQLRDVRDQSLSDFLGRGGVDLKLIQDAATGRDRLPGYQTQFKSVVGTRESVDISAARLRSSDGDLGFGFIIRRAPQGELPDSEAASVMSEDAMKNVMDLVGTASLKELVSATSDVVEKMCIETAVKLTNNNRVAAAEMLGLSRQSLYVKLRKYGLLRQAPET